MFKATCRSREDAEAIYKSFPPRTAVIMPKGDGFEVIAVFPADEPKPKKKRIAKWCDAFVWGYRTAKDGWME